VAGESRLSSRQTGGGDAAGQPGVTLQVGRGPKAVRCTEARTGRAPPGGRRRPRHSSHWHPPAAGVAGHARVTGLHRNDVPPGTDLHLEAPNPLATRSRASSTRPRPCRSVRPHAPISTDRPATPSRSARERASARDEHPPPPSPERAKASGARWTAASCTGPRPDGGWQSITGLPGQAQQGGNQRVLENPERSVDVLAVVGGVGQSGALTPTFDPLALRCPSIGLVPVVGPPVGAGPGWFGRSPSPSPAGVTGARPWPSSPDRANGSFTRQSSTASSSTESSSMIRPRPPSAQARESSPVGRSTAMTREPTVSTPPANHVPASRRPGEPGASTVDLGNGRFPVRAHRGSWA